MKKTQCLRVVSAAAVLAMVLTACGKNGASGSLNLSGSSSGGTSSMSGSSTGTQQNQQAAWRTGLGMASGAETADRAATVYTAAAAVLLDKDGKLVQVQLDELKSEIKADGSGAVTMPADLRTKRELGESYPLQAVSSLGKGWTEQADYFAEYLVGMTGEQVQRLSTDEKGYPEDADLLAGCTISVARYRDAVARACANAEAAGASQGDTLTVGIAAAEAADNRDAADDADGLAGLTVTAAAVTQDKNGRLTSAVCDVLEPQLTVVSDGMIDRPDEWHSKQEQGDDYGLRGASGLKKEWYEQAEGFARHLEGQTSTEISGLAENGSDADLAAVCTIDISDLKKAVLKAMGQSANAGTRRRR